VRNDSILRTKETMVTMNVRVDDAMASVEIKLITQVSVCSARAHNGLVV
jgi:hypothetical protein